MVTKEDVGYKKDLIHVVNQINEALICSLMTANVDVLVEIEELRMTVKTVRLD